MNLVELRAVRLGYAGVTVLHELDLTLAPGQVLGLFGHNGAGKTSTMKLILGLLRPDLGTVRVLGADAGHPRVRRGLGYLPENVTFYPQLTGRETLGYFARLKGSPRHQVATLLEQVGLGAAADRRVRTYSKGMRQRLGLAQALLGEPRLLLLDEPTVGLDPIATGELYQLIDTLKQRGCGVVLCSHVLSGIEPYIDRAMILYQGRVRAVGSLGALREQAGLPVRLHLHRDPGGERIYHTAASDKVATLRTLLNGESVLDVEIWPPTLEDLYRHFQSVPAGDAR